MEKLLKENINEDKLRKLIEQPLINLHEIKKRQDAVEILNKENALGTDITERSINEIDNEEIEEGGKTNEKKAKARRASKWI